jgi:hypothetical protein
VLGAARPVYLDDAYGKSHVASLTPELRGRAPRSFG